MAKIESQIEEEAEGCFTSMIDIVFLLLIFFILQPFKAPDYQMAAYLPKDMGGSSSSAEVKPTIQLGIVGSNNNVTFTVNDESVNADFVAARLVRESGGDLEVPVALKPGPQVNFKWVLKALDQCAIAEMEKVTFSADF